MRMKMETKRIALFLAASIFGAYWLGVASSKHCARFDFSTLTNQTLTAIENTTISFPFHLYRNSCTEQESFVLTVAKIDGDTGRFSYICKILHTSNGICHSLSQQSVCYCLEEVGKYRFTKPADMADGGTWVWLTSEDLAGREEVVFRIIRPPSITRLTLAGFENSLPRPAPPNGHVFVVCSWDAGNPPITVRLLDRHGAILTTSNGSSGQIQYTLTAVGCRDAGLIRCEAPGASQNQTATLLITCPPELLPPNEGAFKVEAAGEAKLNFRVRMHATNISNCELTKNTSTLAETLSIERSNGCRSLIRMTGAPPDLVLTVRLNNVRKQDEGQWSLTLTNDVGSGNVDFYLQVTERDVNVTMAKEDSSSSSGVDSNVFIIVGVNVTTIVFVSVIVLVIVSVRRSRRGPQREEHAQEEELRHVLRAGLAAEERRIAQDREESHIYDLAQEAECSTDYTALKRRPTPGEAATVSDDYLHPVPSCSHHTN